MKKLTALLLLFAFLIPASVFAAYDGTSNGVTFSAPKYGAASGDFTGVSDYVSMGNVLDFPSTLSVEAWIKESGSNLNGASIVDNSNSGWSSGYGLAFTDPNTIIFFINFGWGGYEATYTLGNNGEWHHVVGTYDGQNIRIFVDGIEGVPYAYASYIEPNSTSESFMIGSGPGGNFTGYIDEVAIYDIALSPTTITNHYQSANYQSDVSNTSGLVSYWRFDNDFLDAPVASVPLTELELLQQIKDALDQIDAKAQAIQEVTAGSTAVDWNKTMSFVVGTLSSLAFVFASRFIL